MRHFAISGATGFVGKRLVHKLVEDGQSVHYMGRSRSPDLPSVAAYAAWDPKRAEAPAEALRPADAVIHLAGEPVAQRWNEDVKRRILESRTIGTRNLVKGLAALRTRPEVLVSASASGYYGDRGDELLSESAPPGRGFLPDVCVAWEKEALAAEILGIRVVLVRISIVLHPEGGALQQMLTPFRAGIGGKLGSGKQWMPWIHLDDLVRVLLFAAETGSLSGPVNANAGAVRNEEFTAGLARTLNRPAVIPTPMFALKLLFGEMASVLLASQRMEPQALRAHGFEFSHPTLPGALHDLLD